MSTRASKRTRLGPSERNRETSSSSSSDSDSSDERSKDEVPAANDSHEGAAAIANKGEDGSQATDTAGKQEGSNAPPPSPAKGDAETIEIFEVPDDEEKGEKDKYPDPVPAASKLEKPAVSDEQQKVADAKKAAKERLRKVNAERDLLLKALSAEAEETVPSLLSPEDKRDHYYCSKDCRDLSSVTKEGFCAVVPKFTLQKPKKWTDKYGNCYGCPFCHDGFRHIQEIQKHLTKKHFHVLEYRTRQTRRVHKEPPVPRGRDEWCDIAEAKRAHDRTVDQGKK